MAERHRFSNELFQTELLEEQFVYTCLKSQGRVELRHCVDHTSFLRMLSDELALPLVLDLNKIKGIDVRALEHLALWGREPHVEVLAIVVGDAQSRIIGHQLLGTVADSIPTRLFYAYKPAKDWILQFLWDKTRKIQ